MTTTLTEQASTISAIAVVRPRSPQWYERRRRWEAMTDDDLVGDVATLVSPHVVTAPILTVNRTPHRTDLVLAHRQQPLVVNGDRIASGRGAISIDRCVSRRYRILAKTMSTALVEGATRAAAAWYCADAPMMVAHEVSGDEISSMIAAISRPAFVIGEQLRQAQPGYAWIDVGTDLMLARLGIDTVSMRYGPLPLRRRLRDLALGYGPARVTSGPNGTVRVVDL